MVLLMLHWFCPVLPSLSASYIFSMSFVLSPFTKHIQFLSCRTSGLFQTVLFSISMSKTFLFFLFPASCETIPSSDHSSSDAVLWAMLSH